LLGLLGRARLLKYEEQALVFVLSTSAPFLIIEIAPARSRKQKSWIKL
jgi:hypothetical protein